MATGMRSVAARFPLLLLAFLQAGCSLFGSGTHKHPSVTRDDRPRLNLPERDEDLDPHVPKQVIVRTQKGTSPESIAADMGAAVVDTLPSLNAVLLQFPADVQVVDAVRRLQDDTGVRYAEPNYRVQGGPDGYGAGYGGFYAPSIGGDGASFIDTLAIGPSTAHPEVDPRQWGIHAVGAPEAWEYSTGEGVFIAVLDTGIDPDHPDLRGKVRDGVNAVVGEGPDRGWRDVQGHGTHVAGIAAGAGSPGGIVGVAPGAELLAVKVLKDD